MNTIHPGTQAPSGSLIDFIGDTHGELASLTALLIEMGYRLIDGAYRHPLRTAVFVGDLIDRGHDQVGVYRLVRAMVEAGSGRTILGNHEINAIAWLTPDPNHKGEFCRTHDANHSRQHQSFLDQVGEGTPLHHEIVNWFKTQPLFIDGPDYRVAHASWSQEAINELKPFLTATNCIKNDAYTIVLPKDNKENDWVEQLTKGITEPLPEGVSYLCKSDVSRTKVRVKWWLDRDKEATLDEVAMSLSESTLALIGDTRLPPSEHNTVYCASEPPCFIGHYWLTGAPEVLQSNVCCVDYSVAGKQGGKMVAYRFNGERELTNDRFFAVMKVAGEELISLETAAS